MAFHQPTQQTRQVPAAVPSQIAADQSDNVPSLNNESVEWVLFSPPATTQTGSALAEPALRLSDFASFDTSAQPSSRANEGESSGNRWVEEEAEEDLESLDCHLHDFAVHPPTHATTGGVNMMKVPRHDGFGSFLHAVEDVHGQLLALDTGLPAMPQRRRDSRPEEAARDSSKTRRIEAWRNEHSQTLLNEMVEKQARGARRRKRGVAKGGPTIYFPPSDSLPEAGADEAEPLLERLTMRIIRDLLGIDEELLSILFGESLPREPPDAGLESGSSSRNYWDIPGGSVASTGGPGAWAEA